MAVHKSALANDFVKMTRLRNTESFVFYLRLSGLSALFYLIRVCKAFVEHNVSFQMHLRK